MKLLQIAQERNEVQKQMQSMVGNMAVPFSLAERWVKTESAYQIKLANIESSKQASIIKSLTQEIEDLKRGVK